MECLFLSNVLILTIQTKPCTPDPDIMSAVRVTANAAVKQSFTGKVIFYDSNSQRQVWEKQTVDSNANYLLRVSIFTFIRVTDPSNATLYLACIPTCFCKFPPTTFKFAPQAPVLAVAWLRSPRFAGRHGGRCGRACRSLPRLVLQFDEDRVEWIWSWTWEMDHQFIFNLSIPRMFEILDILDPYHHVNNTFNPITKFGFIDFGISRQFCRQLD